jgi:hypothetical protein
MRIEQIMAQVRGERVRQVAKWGRQTHPDGTGPTYLNVGAVEQAKKQCEFERATTPGGPSWMAILNEEVREAFAERDRDRLRAELLQVAAVAVAWAEDLDQRK